MIASAFPVTMSYVEMLSKKEQVLIYKETRDTKLGVTFYRSDPQDGGHNNSAIISKLNDSGPAWGVLHVGERILSVQGVDVEGPLHAARLLRESEGYLRIHKLPTRDDFERNKNRYAQIEAEAARKALEDALPGQQPGNRTPRTDAATPRGPGASTMPLLTGLKVINQPNPAPGPNVGQILNIGPLNIEAATENAKKSLEGFQQNLGNISARATKWFSDVGSMLPTQQNKENRAALKIQRHYRAFAARGHFHEERGAVLMLQAAARRHKAQMLHGKYKRTLVHWAAMTIQDNWRRHKKRKERAAAKALKAQQEVAARVMAAQQAEAEAAAAKQASGGGMLTKLSRSLSFTKRNKKSEGSTPRGTPRGSGEDGATPVVSGASTTASEASPTAGDAAAAKEAAAPTTKKRSLSFTRRKKASAAAGDGLEDSKQTL